MTDLVACLHDALDEAERVARGAMLTADDDGKWMVSTNPDDGEVSGVLGRCIHIGMIGGNGDLDSPAQAQHIAAWHPRRVLDLVAAHREILDEIVPIIGADETRITGDDLIRALAKAVGVEV